MNDQHISGTRFMTRFMLALLAVFSLGSCAQSDVSEPGVGDGAVLFGAYVGTTVGTRAYVADLDAMKQTGFGVFASSTGSVDFNPDPSAGFTPDFLCNQLVTWSSSGNSGVWIYDPVKSWPTTKLSFFAYAPYSAGGGQTGIVGLSGPQDPGSPKLTFRMDADVDAHTDLLYADASTTLNLVKSGTVQFAFRHALSRVGFSCEVGNDVDPDSHVTLKGITFRSSRLPVAGDLDLCSGRWGNLVKEDMAYSLTVAGADLIATDDGLSLADGKYLMLIPSEGEVPVEITVDYDVTTADGRLDGGSITISNSRTTRFDHNFELGKAYWFTLRVGPDAVVVGVDVADWENTDSDWKPNENNQNV